LIFSNAKLNVKTTNNGYDYDNDYNDYRIGLCLLVCNKFLLVTRFEQFPARFFSRTTDTEY